MSTTSRGWARPAPGSSSRGMVTAEIALGTVAVVLLAIMIAWGASLAMAQVALADSAAEIARQAARGDDVAVALAREDVPDGAEVTVTRRDGAVVVEVRRTVRPWGLRLPPLVLTAHAQVLLEPS